MNDMKISRRLGLDKPSWIFEMRCGGFKGVLVAVPDKLFNEHLIANDQNPSPRLLVMFRESQRKFDVDSTQMIINVVSWVDDTSLPSKLNSEFLMVLDGLIFHSSSPRSK